MFWMSGPDLFYLDTDLILRFTPTQDDAGFGSMMSVDASGN